MKKISLFIILLFILILTGCKNNTINNEYYYKFVDSNNTTITLKEKPKNVAILFSSFVEIYNIAGGETNITVQESITRGLVNNDVILVDSGAGKVINTETLVAAQPDFVIGSLDISAQVKTCEFLNDLNIPSALFKVETFDDYLKVLKILCEITGNNNNYETYGLDVKNNINNILNNIDKSQTKKILFIRSGSSSSSCKAKNKDLHFACIMLDEIGTYNIADEAKILLDGLSVEEILLNEPDYIFVSIMGDLDAGIKYVTDLFNSKTYNNLKAIKNNNYYFLPKDLFQYKPNHRWDQAYKYLVDIIYETN